MGDEELRRAELRMFLQGRRARIRPEDVGLPSGGRRRVPGLRREEVASLAGVGLTWYTMFETGTASGVSSEVIDSVARALQLSPGEKLHLEGLAARVSWQTVEVVADDLVLEVLHRWLDVPAYVITRPWDVVAWNAAYSYVWGIEKPGSAPFNVLVRYFLEEHMRGLHGEGWPSFARVLVGMFRLSWARHLADDRYNALLAALKESDDFAKLWELQDVEHPMAGMTVTIESPTVGRFTYEVLNLEYPTSDQQALVLQVPRGPGANAVRSRLQGLR